MKIIIQCAGQKQANAGRLRDAAGKEVLFVARPELCTRDDHASLRYCRPDDPVGPGSGTWREALVAYNLSGENPCELSAAANLYRRDVYRDLASTFGHENVFILSAGWGLIRSDFLIPDYDITFTPQAPVWARRPTRVVGPLRDLNHLTSELTSRLEPIHFFGGKGYLPLLYALTAELDATIIVHHKGTSPRYSGFIYDAYRCDRNQNWHYDAAKAFIDSALASYNSSEALGRTPKRRRS